MAIESLAEFVSRLRASEDWSRDDVARRAKRAGHEISASYIAKIEAGSDPAAISIEKLDALAAGLKVSRDDLSALIEPNKQARPPLTVITDLGEHAYPWTSYERGIIEKAERLGFGSAFTQEPGVQETPPEDRKRLFRDMEGVIEEFERMAKGGRK